MFRREASLPDVAGRRPVRRLANAHHASNSAFTLFEIMIVVAIIGIVGSIGIPSVVGSLKKEGMRKAVSDFVEGCSHARAAAIFSGNDAFLVIHPQDKSISIQCSGGQGTERPMSFSATLPENIHIDLMGINFIEMQDAEEAKVRFHPNGTCDEFAMLLRSDQNEIRKITLDVVTALADVEGVQ